MVKAKLDIGNKVKIKSKFHGMYDGLTGVIKGIRGDGFIEVEFDETLRTENYPWGVVEEIFYPSELNIIGQIK